MVHVQRQGLLRRHSGRFPRMILLENMFEEFQCKDTASRYSCSTLAKNKKNKLFERHCTLLSVLQETLEGHSCVTLCQDALQGNFCRFEETPLRGTRLRESLEFKGSLG